MPEAERSASTSGSVGRLRDGLASRNPDAITALWARYFEPLARVAASRMNPAVCRSGGPEDVARDVILEFCRLLAEPDVARRFPRLSTRQNLWAVLVRMTVYEAFDKTAKFRRQLEIVAGESAFGPTGPDGVVGTEPAPEFVAAVNDLLEQLATWKHPEQGRRLQTVARMILEGYTHAEIAAELLCSERDVGRKLKLIRKIWQDRSEDPTTNV